MTTITVRPAASGVKRLLWAGVSVAVLSSVHLFIGLPSDIWAHLGWRALVLAVYVLGVRAFSRNASIELTPTELRRRSFLGTVTVFPRTHDQLLIDARRVTGRSDEKPMPRMALLAPDGFAVTRISGVHWDETTLTLLAEAFGDQRILLTQKLTTKQLGAMFPHAVAVIHRRPWVVAAISVAVGCLVLWGWYALSGWMSGA